MSDNIVEEDVFSDTMSNRGELEALVQVSEANQPASNSRNNERIHRSGIRYSRLLSDRLLGNPPRANQRNESQPSSNQPRVVENLPSSSNGVAREAHHDTNLPQIVGGNPSQPNTDGETGTGNQGTPNTNSQPPANTVDRQTQRTTRASPEEHPVDMEEQGRPRRANPRASETVEELLGRLLRESQASRSSREHGQHEPTVIIKKDKVKISQLSDLTGRSIRIFLCQVNAARDAGQDVNLSSHIHPEALDQILCDCPDGTNSSIRKYLEDLNEEERDMARNEPLVLIRTRLKWSDKAEMTNEQKLKDFIRNLKVHMRDIGIGAPEGTLNRERVMQEVVKLLPSELLISTDSVTFNKKFQSVDGLKQLIENRLPLLHQKKKLNRVQAAPLDQTNYLTSRVQQLEHQASFDQNQYLLNKVQQLEKQVVVNRQAEIAPKPPRNYATVAKLAARQGPAVMQPPPNVATPPLVQNNLNAKPMREQKLGIGNKTPFNGTCWNCNQRGHRAEDCPLPETELFKQNLEKFRQMRAEIRHLGTEHSHKCQIEIQGREGNWVQVPGCLDSGADGNVAPESMMDFAEQIYSMSGYTYRLPNGETVSPNFRGMMTVRIQIENKPITLGQIPFHFIAHPLWDQLLVGRPTLAKMKILPEQNVMRMINEQEQH